MNEGDEAGSHFLLAEKGQIFFSLPPLLVIWYEVMNSNVLWVLFRGRQI